MTLDNARVKRASNIFIAVVVLVIGIFAYLVYCGIFNENDYPLQPILLHQNYTINSTNLLFHFQSYVYMHTNSLSSRNPITVTAKLLPNQTELSRCDCSWTDLPPIQIMIFEGASVYPPKYNALSDYPISGFVFLYKKSNPDYYFGNKTLTYESEGKHGYFLMTTDEVNGFLNGKTVHVILDNLQNKTLLLSGIIIGSSEQTSVEKFNNILTMLTLMLLAIGIVQSREYIREGFDWLSRVLSRIRQKIQYWNQNKQHPMSKDDVARILLIVGFIMTGLTSVILFHNSQITNLCIVYTLKQMDLSHCLDTIPVDNILMILSVIGSGALTIAAIIALRRRN